MHSSFKKWSALVASILCFLISKDVLLAQPADLEPTFTGKNGLPSSSINQIAKDEEGRIWIATENGLSIKNINNAKLKHLESEFREPVKQIAFSGNSIYIALSNRINIIDVKSLQTVKSIPLPSTSEITRLRKINGNIWAITTTAVYRIDKLKLTLLWKGESNKRPMDVAYFKNKIFLITYPRSSILMFNGKSFQETPLTKLNNPVYSENFLTLLAKGDTLIIGGDHICNLLIIKDKPVVKRIRLNYSFYTNPAIWDLIKIGNRVFYAIGNTHQEDQGVTTTTINQPINYFSNRYYTKCLFYDSTNDCLYIGTKHRGVFIQKNISKSFEIGDFIVAETNQKNELFYYNNSTLKINTTIDTGNNNPILLSKTYPNSSLRKIKTIGDTSYIMSIQRIDYIIDKNIKPVQDLSNNYKVGRFFNDCFRQGNDIYFFSYYNSAWLLDLNKKKYNSIGTANLIPKVEKSGNKLICFNEGKGFKIYDNLGEHIIKDNEAVLSNIDDFTCSNDTVYVLLNNKISAYKIKGYSFQFLTTYNIEESITDFKANWIFCSQTAGLYLISNDALIKWGNNGQILLYHYLGNRSIAKKPVFDIFNRLLSSAGGTITILEEKQLASIPTRSKYEIDIPEQLTEQNNGIIEIHHPNYFIQNHSLKKVTIKSPTQIFFQKWFTGSTIEIPSNLKAGQYEILLSANNEHIANRFIKITLPLSRNPLFFIGIGILLIVFLFLIFKLKYNEKIYAKRIVDNKIDMLNKNLNPHFVFNSLNLIYNNILTENKEAALGVLLKFSKLQRNFLERSKEKHVTLSTELLFIKSYLDIEFLRYAKDISVGYQENIDPVVNLEKISIPPNILQPLIENSLKYGAIGYEGSEEKNIILEVIKKGDGVLLSIENPKDKNHSTQSTINGFGMGLAIVNERIKLFNQEMSTTYQLRHGLPASKFKMGYRVELHIE